MGGAKIFEKRGGGWVSRTETAKLTASDAGNSYNFGLGIAIHNNIAVVGAFKDDLNNLDEGSAYIFEKPIAGWTNMTETAKLITTDATNW